MTSIWKAAKSLKTISADRQTDTVLEGWLLQGQRKWLQLPHTFSVCHFRAQSLCRLSSLLSSREDPSSKWAYLVCNGTFVTAGSWCVSLLKFPSRMHQNLVILRYRHISDVLFSQDVYTGPYGAVCVLLCGMRDQGFEWTKKASIKAYW